MNSLVVFFMVAVAAASAVPSVLLGGTIVGPGNPGAVLRGPVAEAAVHGPDGSLIGAAADAGTLIAAPIPGGVVSGAVSPGIVGIGAPALVGGIGHGIGLGVGLVGGHGW